jgi:hypothetical protein
MQLLHHYWVDRNNPSVYLTATNNQGKFLPRIEGLDIVHRFTDENGIECFLSQVPDEEEVTEVDPFSGITRTYIKYRVTETEGAGMKIIDQATWDQLIADYDARQTVLRWDVTREYRDQLLQLTDWVVIKAKETGVNLSAEFKTWRQSLRDLPNSTPFPITLPVAPAPVEGVEESVQGAYGGALRSVPMINDPLPAPVIDPFLGIE